MASLFGTYRITGDVSNEEARNLAGFLTTAVEVLQAAGVEVKGSFDIKYDREPEVVETPSPAPEPEPESTEDEA